MGGRGSNSGLSASSLGGSGGGANLPPLVVPLASVQPQQSPVALQNQPAPPTPASLAPNAPPMGVTLSDVQQMDDTSMHDFLINVQSVDMPQFLCDSHLQRMIYGLGMNDKPQIVSIQIGVLARSPDTVGKNDLVDVEKKTYRVLDINKKLKSDSKNDLYNRLVVTQTVALRNGFGLKENPQ